MRSLLASIALTLFPTLLFASTDLILFTPPTDSRIPAGGTIDLETQLFNTGPDIARNTVISFDFPPELTLIRIKPTIGQCSTGSRPVRCTLGDLAANETREFRFSLFLAAPRATFHAAVTISVTSDTAETYPASNMITRTFEILEAVNLSLQGGFVTRRVDPGTDLEARTTITNFLDSEPHDIRVHYELTSGTIERIAAPQGWSCSTEGGTAECRRESLDPNCRCGGGDLVVTVRTPADRTGGVTTLKMSATTSLPEFYPGDFHTLLTSAETYRWFVVTSSGDDGPGSLRETIDRANAGCGDLPCKIAFEISGSPEADGAFLIAPSTPLPPLKAPRIFVDGKTQTAFSGDTNPSGPEIVLDGRFTHLARGLDIGSPCEAVVEGLAVGDFEDHALFMFEKGPCVARSANDVRRVAGNYLGTNARGDEARPNLRGLYAAGTQLEVRDNVISGNHRSGAWVDARNFTAQENRIGVAADGVTPLSNGASGIYLTSRVGVAEILRNRISFNQEMGIAVDRATGLVDIRQNSMRHNGGLGIDIGLDGPNAQEEDTPSHGGANAPVLFHATYDAAANATVITGALRTAPLGNFGSSAQIDVYSNDGPDGDGEQWIGDASFVDTTGQGFTIAIAGDHRNQWLNATSTRVHFLFRQPPAPARGMRGPRPTSIAGGETKTSELSNAVHVE